MSKYKAITEYQKKRYFRINTIVLRKDWDKLSEKRQDEIRRLLKETAISEIKKETKNENDS